MQNAQTGETRRSLWAVQIVLAENDPKYTVVWLTLLIMGGDARMRWIGGERRDHVSKCKIFHKG